MQSVTKFCIGLWFSVTIIVPVLELAAIYFTGEKWLSSYIYFWPAVALWLYLGGVLFVANQEAAEWDQKRQVENDRASSDKKE